MPKMIQDSTTGKFTGRAPDPDNDWKSEPLVWERAYPNPAPAQPEAINAIGVDLELTNDAGERVQIIGLTKRKKAQPQTTLPVVTQGWQYREGGRKIAPAGQRKGTCSKCKGPLDNAERRYCNACAAAANRASRERRKERA